MERVQGGWEKRKRDPEGERQSDQAGSERGGRHSREVDDQEWRESARSGTDHKEAGGWRCKTEHQTGQVREQAWMCERAMALLHPSFPTDL